MIQQKLFKQIGFQTTSLNEFSPVGEGHIIWVTEIQNIETTKIRNLV